MNLFISTAIDDIVIVLFDDKIKKVLEINNVKRHSEIFFDEIKKLNINFKQIEKVYVITKPGSFTGLRLANVFTQVLKECYSTKVYGINLLELLSYQYQEEICIDAKGGQYYFLENNDIIITTNPKTLINPKIIIDESLISFLKTQKNESIKIDYVKNPIS